MDLTAAVWRDTKRPLWPLALAVPALPFASLALVSAGGGPWGWWLTPVFIFAVIPVIDMLIGEGPRHPPEEAVPALQRSPYYRWITFLYLPAEYAALAVGCAAWVRDPDPVAAVGLVLTVGIVQRGGHQHGPRTGPQARAGGAVAVQDHANADRYGHF